MFDLMDVLKIGLRLTGFGLTFLFLGVILLFDKGLLASGNLLFIRGLACFISIEWILRLFFHKREALFCFFGNIIVNLIGWPIIDMIAETYGFFLQRLFPARNQLPERRTGVFLRGLCLPVISSIVNRLAGDSGKTMA